MPSMRTLQDVKDSGSLLVAVCDDVQCRHTQFVDLEKLIYHAGALASLLPIRGQTHFSERMRCPECGGRGMFLWPELPKDPVPLLSGLHMQVNNWMGDSLVSVLAAASHSSVAVAAYEAAIKAYPSRRITLQEGGRVIHDNRWRVVKGGKVG